MRVFLQIKCIVTRKMKNERRKKMSYNLFLKFKRSFIFTVHMLLSTYTNLSHELMCNQIIIIWCLTLFAYIVENFIIVLTYLCFLHHMWKVDVVFRECWRCMLSKRSTYTRVKSFSGVLLFSFTFILYLHVENDISKH